MIIKLARIVFFPDLCLSWVYARNANEMEYTVNNERLWQSRTGNYIVYSRMLLGF